MVPSDADSIQKQYEILVNELEMYNEELLDKPRLLAVTKSDLIDDELKKMLEAELPKDLPYIFISAVAQAGLVELKDKLWKMLTS
jgi:GTP-binding protein